MRKTCLLLIAFTFLFAHTLFAVTVNISGQVYLSDQSEPDSIKVVFERVVPSALKDSTITAADGSFSANIEKGIYKIYFIKDGYFQFETTEKPFYSDTILEDISLVAQTSFLQVPLSFSTIQEAINAANNGDTVLVAPSKYYENINYNGKNITVASHFLTTNDTSYISQTVIDGSQNGHVVEFLSGEDSTAVLTGLTITNGYMSEGNGGGIICLNSNPTFSHIMVVNCEAESGGGIYFQNSHSRLIQSSIYSNVFELNGGGIAVEDSSVIIISHCHINENRDGRFGGGVFIQDYSIITLLNTEIAFNYASAYGGGIYVHDHSTATIMNVDIYNNGAYYFGGGIFSLSNINYGNFIITDSIIRDNFANKWGGGIFCYSGDIYNVVISGNQALKGGGITYANDWAPLYVTNVSIIGNSADSGGGFYQLIELDDRDSQPSLTNCIIAYNSGDAAILGDDRSDPAITFSNFYGNENANVSNIGDWISVNVTTNANGDSCDAYNNIKLNPQFIDFENENFHLSENSPCINAGTLDGAPERDIEGNLRISFPDIGAYEYLGPVFVEEKKLLPPKFVLHQNHPNPFNPTTTLNFTLSEPGDTNLSIYNIAGQKIRELLDSHLPAGSNQILWDGRDETGTTVSSGIYFARLVSGEKQAVQKMMLMK